ncbi:MAG: DUF4416 family protein [Anaerolineae bacterium]
MGTISQPAPVKLVMPMLSADPALLALAEETLAGAYGSVDYRSATLPFNHTAYYQAEFGTGLLRRFLTFRDLVDPGRLAAIKRHTNSLEAMWSGDTGQRRINLDPGYLTQAKLVLASTKNHAHRVYIGQGIYAEVTLMFRAGGISVLPWTYPDYRSEEYHEILLAIRRIFTQQIKAADEATRRSG